MQRSREVSVPLIRLLAAVPLPWLDPAIALTPDHQTVAEEVEGHEPVGAGGGLEHCRHGEVVHARVRISAVSSFVVMSGQVGHGCSVFGKDAQKLGVVPGTAVEVVDHQGVHGAVCRHDHTHVVTGVGLEFSPQPLHLGAPESTVPAAVFAVGIPHV